MPTQLSEIERQVRDRLDEPVPRHWSSQEMIDIINLGIKDLWREIVNLKGEHFLVINTEDVWLRRGEDQLSNVPTNVHKIYLIEPVDIRFTQSRPGSRVAFRPADYNHDDFVKARAYDSFPIEENGGTVLYCITGQGGPVSTLKILTAPRISNDLQVRFSYVPTLAPLVGSNFIPIPGEADNTLIAWTIAYARAKEREDRSPDPAWLMAYDKEKDALINSLGLRQYQEEQVADAIFQDYWF